MSQVAAGRPYHLPAGCLHCPHPGKVSGLTAPCPVPDPLPAFPPQYHGQGLVANTFGVSTGAGERGEHKRTNPNPAVTLVPDQHWEGPASTMPTLALLPSSLKCTSLGAGSCRLGFCWGCVRTWSKTHPNLGVTAPARLGVSPQGWLLRCHLHSGEGCLWDAGWCFVLPGPKSKGTIKQHQFVGRRERSWKKTELEFAASWPYLVVLVFAVSEQT